MNTILINTAIIAGALFIWFANHHLEERELNGIEQQIEREKYEYEHRTGNAKRTGSNVKGQPENNR